MLSPNHGDNEGAEELDPPLTEGRIGLSLVTLHCFEPFARGLPPARVGNEPPDLGEPPPSSRSPQTDSAAIAPSPAPSARLPKWDPQQSPD